VCFGPGCGVTVVTLTESSQGHGRERRGLHSAYGRAPVTQEDCIAVCLVVARQYAIQLAVQQ
jgi:hypothetical protein